MDGTSGLNAFDIAGSALNAKAQYFASRPKSRYRSPPR